MTATNIRVQMAQRSDTAANWTAANPILLSGEIGYETDTEKLKIGDGTTNWNSLAYLPIPDGSGNLTITGNLEIRTTGTLTFEGSTADGFETTLAVTDPTADRTITLPNVSGTVVTTGDTGSVTSTMIADGTIVNADVSATAEIAVSKLANGAANQVLVTDGADVSWSDDLTLAGNLTVNGTTTTVNTETLVVEDKNIDLGVVGTPTDLTADGGGITLKGTTDKTINWVDATDSWTSSENVDLASGKSYRINNTEVLNSTTLGSGVTGSSLTSVGTISSGTWQGTAIDAAYLDSTVVTSGDTGIVTSTMIADGTIVNDDINASAAIADTKLATISTAGKVSNSATTATNANTASAIVARDASGDFSAGTVTADLTGNADTATALSSSRTFAVTGDVTGTVSSDLTSGASIATSIASGVIVDGDVNASAAIAGTKIDPDFGSQTVETTGVFSAAGGAEATPSITFTGDTNTGIYSPGADQLALSTNGTQRINIEADGDINIDSGGVFYDATNNRLGIGTAGPSYPLDVNGAIHSDGTNGGLYFGGNSTTPSVGSAIHRPAADTLAFVTASNERARIDSSGRLLVGTSSSSFISRAVFEGNSGDATGSGYIRLTIGTASPSDGTDLGGIIFSDSGHRTSALIVGTRDGGTWTSGSSQPSRLVFSTTPNGSSSPTERWRITSGGTLVSSGGNLDVTATYSATTANSANMYVGPGGVYQRSTSSIKYKTDVETLQDKYADAVLECRPVWYRSTCENDCAEHSWWGFIAEEVAEIDPRLVHWKTIESTIQENGRLVKIPCNPEPDGVAYDRFVPHLLNLIKRQKEQIEAMEARLSALETP